MRQTCIDVLKELITHLLILIVILIKRKSIKGSKGWRVKEDQRVIFINGQAKSPMASTAYGRLPMLTWRISPVAKLESSYSFSKPRQWNTLVGCLLVPGRLRLLLFPVAWKTVDQTLPPSLLLRVTLNLCNK